VKTLVLVSVVMPSYNHSKYLADTINSVLNQTFSDLELIIVDDCSKDNSREIIQTYRNKDNRVKPIFHEKNMEYPIPIMTERDMRQGNSLLS